MKMQCIKRDSNQRFSCVFALIRGCSYKILDIIMVKLEKILKNKKLFIQNILEV